MIKSLVFLLFSFVLLCCNPDNHQSGKEKEYAFRDVTANFVKNTRVTTFIQDGKPISGIVTRKRRNGGKITWEVEKGLATKQTMYYSNGNVERMLEMKNGVEHGTFVIFFSDGEKHLEQFYDEGKPVGTWRRWNKNGELMDSIRY